MEGCRNHLRSALIIATGPTDGLGCSCASGTKPLSKIERRERPKEPKDRRVALLSVAFGNGMTLGSDHIALLETIARTGSISSAARELRISYRHAWMLVDALNHMFRYPVLVATHGGARGGGATITELGIGIAAAYRRAEERARVRVCGRQLGPRRPSATALISRNAALPGASSSCSAE